MSPRPVVVSEIGTQGSLEVLGVADQEMIQAVPADRADQAFDVGILPWTRGAVSTSSIWSEEIRKRTSSP